MDLEQLGYFIYMDECEKAQQKKQQTQQEQEEQEEEQTAEVQNWNMFWWDSKPHKYRIGEEKNIFPEIHPGGIEAKFHQILGQNSLRAIGDFSIIVAGNIKKLYSLYEWYRHLLTVSFFYKPTPISRSTRKD